MKNLLLILLLLVHIMSFGQTEGAQISSSDKSKFFKLIHEKCPDADILEIESKEDYIEIEYLCDGKFYEMGISDYQVLFIETAATDTDVPYDIIKQKLEKKYDGWLLDEISTITTNETSFLKVEIIKDGIEQNLFFTTDGKWYKSESIVISDKWTTETLAESSLYKNTQYNLLSPDRTYVLPELLKEISGISLSDDNKTLFCVQDELGAVFEYDCEKDRIQNIHRFTDIGDFEDVTTIGDMLYVLRSDGKIFYFNYKEKNEIKEFIISVNAFDFESMEYDKLNKEFLVVSKDAVLNLPESKRIVYTFTEAQPGKTNDKFEVDILKINDEINKNISTNAKNDALFSPSAIAIHPITQDIYILSATDRILIVYNEDGLKHVYPLPASTYYKPEGLTFYKNGDLLISNEGDKKGLIKGSILFFKYKK